MQGKPAQDSVTPKRPSEVRPATDSIPASLPGTTALSESEIESLRLEAQQASAWMKAELAKRKTRTSLNGDAPKNGGNAGGAP